jgi:hypothetical protein
VRAAAALLVAVVVVAGAPGVSGAASAPKPVPTWAYYYIWFNAGSWNRAKVDYPLLGRYSSDETSVLRAHVRMAKQAGIDGFIVSWKSTPVLNRRLARLAKVAAAERFHLAIIYQGLDFHRRPLAIARIASDLARFERTFARLRVFRGFGKPLVIWSGTWMFSARDLASVTSRYRDRLRILASERNAADYSAKATAFDGDAYYWSSVNPYTYPGQAAKLGQIARVVHASGGQWFAPAAAGFDGHLVGHPTVVPRRNGETLRRELDAAMRSDPDAIAIISWNEFSENSHVEPSRNYGTVALRVLADVNRTRLRMRGELDSSQPAGHARGPGPITATLLFVCVVAGAVYLLRRRRRSRVPA